MTPQDEKNLERLINATVRDLPPRRAPSSLESRVQAELARRAALPWWHKSFAHWPLAARGAFVVVSAAIAKLVLMVLVWARNGIDATQFKAAYTPELHGLEVARRLADSASDFVHVVVASIPPVWLYGGIAAFAALYVALFGLGAAAYRTLYASR